MKHLQNALHLSHAYIQSAVKPGDTVVDATCGNGHDTLFLSGLAGKEGRVYGFDVQTAALEQTRARLDKFAAYDNTALIHAGHETMEAHVPPGIAACMFNFGYLPGSDHKTATQAETSLAAIDAALRLLQFGGLVTLCVYYGGDTGFAEKEAILAHCAALDAKEFAVLRHEFVNQPNCPPILVCIEKLAE